MTYDGFDENDAKEQELIEEWMSGGGAGPQAAVEEDAADRWKAQSDLTPLESAQKKVKDLEEEVSALSALRHENDALKSELTVARSLPKRHCREKTPPDPADVDDSYDPMGYGFGLDFEG